MYRVLLVDDEILIREAVSQNIDWSGLGFELAECCANGKEAVAYLEGNKIDLVITDICMPYMDGLALSEFVRKKFPKTELIILSGYEEFEYARRALKCGVTEYILKPVTASELSDILLQVKEKMEKKRRREEDFGDMKTTYQKNKLRLRSGVLMSLITGSRTPEEAKSELSGFEIELNKTDYKVAVIWTKLSKEAVREEKGNTQDAFLLNFIMFNIADEIMEKYHAGAAVQAEDNSVVLLFGTNKPREDEELFENICYEILDNIRDNMDAPIVIGLGRYVKEAKELFRSYGQAVEVQQYSYILGADKVLDAEKIKRQQEASDRYEPDSRSLLMAVKSNDAGEIKKALAEIRKSMKEAVLGKNMVCLTIQQIILEIHKLLEISDLTDSLLYRKKEEVLNEVAHAETGKQACAVWENYLLEAAEEMDNRRNTGGRKFVVMALDYIESHLSESTLTLGNVCSYLGISTSRFSIIFKTTTGETFVENLIRRRMEKAKELLLNTDLKNYEIAEKVGFSDSHYFSVSFKKITGMTPSRWAREKRASGEKG